MAKSTSLVFGLDRGNRGPDPDKEKQLPSFVPPPADDGSVSVGIQGDALSNVHVLSLEAGVTSEAELIERYRTMSLYPEADMAIEEITNEAIVQDDEQDIVQINLDKVELPDNVKKTIEEEFSGTVLKLLDFNYRAHEIFKSWYVDSRRVYHCVVDPAKQKEGILELRLLDPRKIKRIKEIDTSTTNGGMYLYKVVKDYYVYIESATTYNQTFGQTNSFGEAHYNSGSVPKFENAVKINTDAIVFVHSGLVDQTTGTIYGYLQKSIKSFNQLRMMEDALVVYRLARAPERRIFYIDVGAIPPTKQEYYVNRLKNNYRSKMVYDARTGEVADQRRAVSMLEDYWIPRNGNKGTEISTLPGGQSLGQIEDVVYFRDKFWKTLNVPSGRLTDEGSQSLFGNDGSISREEQKFSKFIAKLRRQFSRLFLGILKTQLKLKNILDDEDWEEIEQDIKFKWAIDSSWTELHDADLLQRRLNIIESMQPFVGVYFDREDVLKGILKLTDDQIKELDKRIADQVKRGLIQDPKEKWKAEMQLLQGNADAVTAGARQAEDAVTNPPDNSTA